MLKKLTYKKVWLLYAAAIVISLGLGMVLGAQQFSTSPPLTVAQVLPAVKPLPNISLVNHRGEAVVADSFRGHWHLVFFGFTSCPDYCPLELQKLAKLLTVSGAGDRLRVGFVSVDPERDEQEKLAQYVNFFHPQIIGISGSNAELARFAQFFGAAYDRSAIVNGKVLTVPAGINLPADIGDQYQVNHSTRVFIVNPDGAFMGSFSSPYAEQEMLADMQKLMEQ